MFEAFQASFPRDLSQHSAGQPNLGIPELQGLGELFDLFGGSSFREGLYRVIHPAALPYWPEQLHLAFPEFKGRIICFGYDWLGRMFALDTGRCENDQPGDVMLEPGTGEVLEIPADLLDFHNIELIENEDACLASRFYQIWRANGGTVPEHDRCVGYRVPLFLGGDDEIENLEDSSLEVYWHLTSQLIEQTRDLPVGSPPDSITVKD